MRADNWHSGGQEVMMAQASMWQIWIEFLAFAWHSPSSGFQEVNQWTPRSVSFK